MKKLLFIICIIIYLFSCNHDKWRHVEIISPDKSQVITIITQGENRYIMNGVHCKVPNNNYALLDMSNVDQLGDEVGICWKKDGFDWQLHSFYSKFINSKIDSTKFFIQKISDTDSRGAPNADRYFRDGCVLIYIRGDLIRHNDGTSLRYR